MKYFDASTVIYLNVLMSRGNMSKSTSWGGDLGDQFLDLLCLGFFLGDNGNDQQGSDDWNHFGDSVIKTLFKISKLTLVLSSFVEE